MTPFKVNSFHEDIDHLNNHYMNVNILSCAYNDILLRKTSALTILSFASFTLISLVKWYKLRIYQKIEKCGTSSQNLMNLDEMKASHLNLYRYYICV